MATYLRRCQRARPSATAGPSHVTVGILHRPPRAAPPSDRHSASARHAARNGGTLVPLETCRPYFKEGEMGARFRYRRKKVPQCP